MMDLGCKANNISLLSAQYMSLALSSSKSAFLGEAHGLGENDITVMLFECFLYAMSHDK